MDKFKVLSLVLLMLLAAGCGNEYNQAARNKAVVIAAMDAMDNHAWGELDRYIADDFKRYSQATPEAEINSLDDMKEFLNEWYLAFPDAEMTTRLIIAEDSLVAVWMTFAGTHEGPMGPFPPTGKRMESETFGFFRLEDGKIKESWVTWDNLAGLQQLGLFAPPAAEADSEG